MYLLNNKHKLSKKVNTQNQNKKLTKNACSTKDIIYYYLRKMLQF